MKILLYIKQAWRLIRQERLFSTIYIVGTGLAISLVMVMSIVLYIKFAPLYPEVNRNRVLVLKFGCYTNKEQQSMSSASLSLNLIRQLTEQLDGVQAVSILETGFSEGRVQSIGEKELLRIPTRAVNPDFWKVNEFRFVEGKPFSEEDFTSGLFVAVIGKGLAKRLFGEESAVGREVVMNYQRYRVTGVVQSASTLNGNVYAELYFPYTTLPDIYNEYQPGLGGFQATLLMDEGASSASIRRQIEKRLQQFNQTLEEHYTFEILGQPDPFWVSTLRRGSNVAPDIPAFLWQYGTICLLLLLIPAVSLSGMADSRMNRRLAELGVRRAFGAPRTTLFGQILTENLIYTLFGGLLGLLVSFGLVEWTRGWIFFEGMTAWSYAYWAGIELPIGSLLNPWVF
ncbi:MAG: ABC transporter permease, partial [Parabacteroides sp.]